MRRGCSRLLHAGAAVVVAGIAGDAAHASEGDGGRTTLLRTFSSEGGRSVKALYELQQSSRLRRTSTSGPQRYSKGQPVSIVCVPQRLVGVDVGHISVLVENHDGSVASVGFYAERYRQGLPLLKADAAILLTPDPLYTRATSDVALRPKIVELYRGRLTDVQAARLNAWTDDAEAGGLTLTTFTTSAGVERELGRVTRLGDDVRYAGLAVLFPGVENCATWAEQHFPGCISCPAGLPRLCRPL